MSSFGIGLGGFVSGLQTGYGIRQDMDDRKDRKARQVRDDAYQDEVRARQRDLWGRDDKQYEREEGQRLAVEKINNDVKTKFDADVAAGNAEADDFEETWRKEALPSLYREMVTSGNVDGAKKLMDWSDSADAKQGRKLFSSAMFKLHSGDNTGALEDVMKAGKLGGYVDHGMDFTGQTDIKDTKGNLVGYRLKIKRPDGKEVLQDIRLGDLPDLIARFANPEAAWESQMAAQKKTADRAAQLEDYEEKKKIDSRYSGVTDQGKQRTSAIAALRKSMDGGLAGDEPKFDDLPREQQDSLIEKEIQLQTGANQPGVKVPQKKVIADTVTGKIMSPEDADQSRVSRQSEKAMSEVESSPEMREKRAASRETELRIQMAQHRLNNLGDDPRKVAADLEATGIPQSLWPPELLKALGANK